MKKALIIMFLVFALIGAVIAAQSSVPQLSVDSLELNGVELTENSVTKLSVERGQEVELKIRLTPFENLKDFEIRAFISGFEYNDVNSIEATTGISDLDKEVNYVKTLKLKLSDLVESDDYKLRVVFSDRNNEMIVKRYNLKVDLPRHALRVSDVIFYPSNTVKAGHALLSNVRVENKGEKDEKDVKVTVSIPSLGLSASDYLKKVETGDNEEQTEELYLRLDKCVPAGNYEAVVNVAYDNNYRTLEPIKKNIQVEANEACGSSSRSASVQVGSSTETLKRGTSIVFPVTVTNQGRSQQSFTLTVNSLEGLDVSVSPSNTAVLDAGSSNTFNVLVTANKDAPLGNQALNARVNSGDKVVEELSLTAQVNPNDDADLKNYLEIGLIVLVVVLLVIALLLAFSKLTGKDEEYY
ncbi:hypothetical protein HZA97_03500 [Candidatus Woesearchaeota archaeon]|nr:hypothetical protein [Candidatus Woesearchaeota archaeon]